MLEKATIVAFFCARRRHKIYCKIII